MLGPQRGDPGDPSERMIFHQHFTSSTLDIDPHTARSLHVDPTESPPRLESQTCGNCGETDLKDGWFVHFHTFPKLWTCGNA